MNNDQTRPKVRAGNSKKHNFLEATGSEKPTSPNPAALCSLVFTPPAPPLERERERERDRERQRKRETETERERERFRAWPYKILKSDSVTVNQHMESDISYNQKGGNRQSKTSLQNGIPRQRSSPIHSRYHFCSYLQDDHQLIMNLSSDNNHWHGTKIMCREIPMY